MQRVLLYVEEFSFYGKESKKESVRTEIQVAPVGQAGTFFKKLRKTLQRVSNELEGKR